MVSMHHNGRGYPASGKAGQRGAIDERQDIPEGHSRVSL